MAKRKSTAAPPTAPEQSGSVTYLAPRRWLELVKPQPNADTVALLKGLLKQAEAGELSGVVVCSLYSLHGQSRLKKKYDFSLGGVAYDNPQLAVGAMDVCHMLLKEVALKDSGLA